MKIISTIPARGGSKGILRKNLIELDGKPLISYTINEALKSKKINEVIVSTDDYEIAEISKDLGASVIIRPKELAEDDTPIINVIFQVMEQLKEKYDPSTIIVLLQPTSPLRTTEDIDNAIDLLLKKNCDSVISVYEASHPPYWDLKLEEGYLKPLFDRDLFEKRRQDLYKVYRPNGAIFVQTLENLYKNQSFLGEYSIPYIMPIERSLDIDDEIDFLLAEVLVKKLKKNEEIRI